MRGNCNKYFSFLCHYSLFPIQKNGVGLIDSDIIWEKIRELSRTYIKGTILILFFLMFFVFVEEEYACTNYDQ